MKNRNYCLLAALMLVLSSEQLYADHRAEHSDHHRHKIYQTHSYTGERYIGVRRTNCDHRNCVVTRSRVIREYGGGHRHMRGYRSDHNHHHNHVNNLLLGLAIAVPLILQADHHPRHGNHGRRGMHGRRGRY